jgi:hypothetical protein
MVLDQTPAQITDAHHHGTDILIRTDSAGSVKAFPTHVRDLLNEESVPSSRSDAPSPSPSATLSASCPTASGIPP